MNSLRYASILVLVGCGASEQRAVNVPAMPPAAVTVAPAPAPAEVTCTLPTFPAPDDAEGRRIFLAEIAERSACRRVFETELVTHFAPVTVSQEKHAYAAKIELDPQITRCSLADGYCYGTLRPKQPLQDFVQLWADLRAGKQGWVSNHVLRGGRPITERHGARACTEEGVDCEIPVSLAALLSVRDLSIAVVGVRAPRQETQAEIAAEQLKAAKNPRTKNTVLERSLRMDIGY